MKRRSFLQAVGGAIAAVIAPVVAAEQVKRLIAFPPPRLAMSLLNTEYGQSIPITPPETLAELRAVIEANYETVHEFKEAPYEQPLGYGIGRAPTAQPPGYTGPFYRGFIIFGRGNNEREAVTDAFKSNGQMLGGKEMMWRQELSLDRLRFFEENKVEFVVRGRVTVLR